MSPRLKRLIARLLRQPPLRPLLGIAVRLFAPRNYVGVAGVIVNQAGQVLLAKHVFRHRRPWGLPGGWVGRGEDPATALRREIREELAVDVEVESLLLCEATDPRPGSVSPRSISIVFRCRIAGDAQPSSDSGEILETRWYEPAKIDIELLALHRKAIELAVASR